MLELLGRFHPVLVHLPIGILLLACLFQWLSVKRNYTGLQPATSIALFIGMLSAVASAISGYLLSNTGDYDEQLVSLHQWMGISVAVVSILFFVLHGRKLYVKQQRWLSVLLFILIIITGHLGGSLTHGAGYLTESFAGKDNQSNKTIRKPIPNVQEAIAYADIIQPLLQEKCYSCHSASKQKGKLRMDQPDLLLKGGKDGVVLISGKADQSELIKRLLLSREEEHHMPPKEKPQLTSAEISLLHWWVASGASFNKKTRELDQPDKIKPILIALQNEQPEKKQDLSIPSGTIEPADEKGIKKLKDMGIVVMPVATGSNYLLVNFVGVTGISDKEMEMLLPIRKQIVWIKLGNTKISDAALSTIAKCENITSVQLDNTNITDKGIAVLANLKQLQILNLVGTRITTQGLTQLKDLKQLQSIYLYHTGVGKSDWQQLQKQFPKTHLDSGGYQVPMLNTDTMVVKPPQRK